MRLTPVVKNLLILNVGLFIIVMVNEAMGNNFNLQGFLSLHYPSSELFRPFQLVSHFFMHADFMHIAFNMFALVMFGPPIESMWGPKRFLTFYFLCALGSAALHLGYTWWEVDQLQAQIAQWWTTLDYDTYYELASNSFWASQAELDQANAVLQALGNGNLEFVREEGPEVMANIVGNKVDIPMLGASGAIFGVLLAFGMQFPDLKLMLLFFPVPVKARYFIPAIMALELFLGFQRYSWDNMAHFAHLGGALVGLILILYWRRFDPPVGNRWDENA